MFITFEGIEGAGKSTQARLLAERLQREGHAVRMTREPGGTPLAGAIRALVLHPAESTRALGLAGLAADDAPGEDPLPLTEALLLSAARAQHVACIRAWLADGAAVICDRFADASRAYQVGARGIEAATMETLIALATGGLQPDVTILLDLPVAEGQRRKQAAHARGGDWNRLDAAGATFHERVRAAYLALARAAPERWLVVDALLAPEAQATRIWATAAPQL